MESIDVTSKNRISMIAALGRETRAIGRDGKLLWRIPEDMARFKVCTVGHPVIMGRKTWESLPERFRPLSGRTNIVVTRDQAYTAEGGTVVHSLEAAFTVAKSSDGAEEIFVIGGGELYREALPCTTRLYLTLVDSDEEGDAYFPEYANEFTNELAYEEHESDGLRYAWVDLERTAA
jgi:dihydrofolate reductase